MKTWLITGASGGLGAQLAREALSRGDRVVLSGRNLDALQQLAAAAPSRALAVRIDVEDIESVRQGVAAALEWSQIDVLVNNAGRGFHGAIEEVSDAESRALFDTNVFGLLNVTRAVLPHMRARRSGHVINIGSVAGLAADAGTGHYCATKFAVEGISESMKVELVPLGIKVTVVEPGPFRTEFNGASARGTQNPIADYAETAGKRAAGLLAGHGKQAGDPAKAARIICDIAAMDEPPLHLLLGSVGIDRARGKLQRLRDEIDAWEERSRATGFDQTAA